MAASVEVEPSMKSNNDFNQSCKQPHLGLLMDIRCSHNEDDQRRIKRHLLSWRLQEWNGERVMLCWVSTSKAVVKVYVMSHPGLIQVLYQVMSPTESTSMTIRWSRVEPKRPGAVQSDCHQPSNSKSDLPPKFKHISHIWDPPVSVVGSLSLINNQEAPIQWYKYRSCSFWRQTGVQLRDPVY